MMKRGKTLTFGKISKSAPADFSVFAFIFWRSQVAHASLWRATQGKLLAYYWWS